MKILSVNTHASQGGAARIAETVHRYLLGLPAGEGISAEMIVGWGNEEPNSNIHPLYRGSISKFANAGWFRLLGEDGRFLSKSSTEMLKGAIQKSNLIHIHNLHGYYLPIRFLELLEDKPVVWTLHDFWITTGRCAYPLECSAWLNQCAKCGSRTYYPASLFSNHRMLYLKKMSLISRLRNLTLTVPSLTFQDELSRFGLNTEDLRVVYNGVDTDTFRPANDSERRLLLSELDIIDDGLIMICFIASQISETRKGMQYLNKAMKVLEKPARFVVIGDKRGAEKVVPESTGHDIIFTGFLPDKRDVAKWLKVADFFINPSISETFGLTNLESLSCGTRPIVFRLPVFQETLSDWGIFVENVGAIELANKINEVTTSRISGKLRSAAHQYVQEKFSEERMCRQFMDIYKEKLRTQSQRLP